MVLFVEVVIDGRVKWHDNYIFEGGVDVVGKEVPYSVFGESNTHIRVSRCICERLRCPVHGKRGGG